MAMLFAITNNAYTQILSIVCVSVGGLRRKQILKLRGKRGKKSTVFEIFEKICLGSNQHHLNCFLLNFGDAIMYNSRDIANVLFFSNSNFLVFLGIIF